MEKPLIEQYFDVRSNLRNQLNEFERESEIELAIIKILIFFLVLGLAIFFFNI